MAQLPSALPCQVSSVASSEVPLGCTAKSMIVVVPPQAAARVPVSNVSAENVPPNGISMWVCASIPPGSTYFPLASMTRSASAAHDEASPEPGAARAVIFSSSMMTSVVAPDGLITLPPAMRVRISASRSRLGQRAVGVRARSR